jgi:nicotinamide-nucleotide amidase
VPSGRRAPKAPPAHRRPDAARRKAPRASLRPAPKVHPDRVGPLHVELVVVGRELLRGRTVDANAPHLTAWLSRRGALVHRITVVDDTDRAVTAAVGEAIGRHARLVITTGGLGPTADDRTLGAVSDALRLPLAVHPRAVELVENAYRRLHARGIVRKAGLNKAREKMCALPVGAEPIENHVGAAPGVLCRLAGGAAVLCLPGVPEEMKAVFEQATALLKEMLPRMETAEREIETPTGDESSLRPLLDRLAEEFPSVWIKSWAAGFADKNTRIRVTLEACAPTRAEAESVVEIAFRRLLALAGGG